MTKKRLTHLDEAGRAAMVDVAHKPVTERTAVAVAELVMQPVTLALILSGHAPKGDVLATARIAGIQAAKRTPELIPLCHGIALSSVRVDFEVIDEASGRLGLRATARATDRTGVEMEALVAASIAALTVYDMVKAVDRALTIESVRLQSKTGGHSDWGQDRPT